VADVLVHGVTPQSSRYDAVTALAGEHAAYAGTATATETAGAVQAAARSTVRRLGAYVSGVSGREDVMVMRIIPPG
jgi:hypothetical protein